MDSKNNFNINMIVILFIIFYILYVINDLKNKINIRENFNSENIIDIEAMRNLSYILSSLTANNKGLIAPCNVTVKNNLNTNGNISTDNDIITKKNLIVKGSINLLPKGIVVAWIGDSAPEGWALCDGQNGTPDLRGRFILGSGQGASLTKRMIRQIGGTETVTLTYDHLPSVTTNFGKSAPSTSTRSGSRTCVRDITITTGNGKSQPHNNMPPFYVLTYIIKL